MKFLPKIFLPLLFFNGIVPETVFCQPESLRNTIERIAEKAEGRIGMAMMNMKTHDTLSFNGNSNFPMQSVFKFPLAVAALHQIDLGKFSLDQKIHVAKNDLLPNTWSPLREKYPNGNVDISLDELISTTVALSDNNGCDILFRLLGGPKTVDTYISSLGVKGISIVANEEEMHADWNIQYRNCSSPHAMVNLLTKFYQDSILSQKSKDYLWQVMVKTTTGTKRLKGKLPEGTIVGHKTGSSGTNDKGLAAATNDAGIIILPDATPVAIVVFVSDSNAKEHERDEVIADIAKAVWDSFVFH